MIKNILYLVCFLLVLGCEQEEPEMIRVNLFIDITDGRDTKSLNIEDDLFKIGQYSGVSETKGGNNGIEFRLFELNNLSESESTTVVLEPSQPGILGKNALDRADEIKEFYQRVASTLNNVHKRERDELNQSKIYQNLCRELNNLALDSSKNLIIIYSDMLENSDLFSFYSNTHLVETWSKDINLALKVLENKDCKLPDLIKTDIHVVSKRKAKNDNLINKAEEFWTLLFESKNAKFHFDADLNLPIVYK